MKKLKIFIGIGIIMIGGLYLILSSITHDDWCKIVKPQYNFSDDKVASYCFNEGWANYCKISYPENCPNNNYSDTDRCLANCRNFGLEENCPCN